MNHYKWCHFEKTAAHTLANYCENFIYTTSKFHNMFYPLFHITLSAPSRLSEVDGKVPDWPQHRHHPRIPRIRAGGLRTGETAGDARRGAEATDSRPLSCMHDLDDQSLLVNLLI